MYRVFKKKSKFTFKCIIFILFIGECKSNNVTKLSYHRYHFNIVKNEQYMNSIPMEYNYTMFNISNIDNITNFVIDNSISNNLKNINPISFFYFTEYNGCLFDSHTQSLSLNKLEYMYYSLIYKYILTYNIINYTSDNNLYKIIKNNTTFIIKKYKINYNINKNNPYYIKYSNNDLYVLFNNFYIDDNFKQFIYEIINIIINTYEINNYYTNTNIILQTKNNIIDNFNIVYDNLLLRQKLLNELYEKILIFDKILNKHLIYFINYKYKIDCDLYNELDDAIYETYINYPFYNDFIIYNYNNNYIQNIINDEKNKNNENENENEYKLKIYNNIIDIYHNIYKVYKYKIQNNLFMIKNIVNAGHFKNINGIYINNDNNVYDDVLFDYDYVNEVNIYTIYYNNKIYKIQEVENLIKLLYHTNLILTYSYKYIYLSNYPGQTLPKNITFTVNYDKQCIDIKIIKYVLE